jgi:hypothetical protein
MSVVAPGRVCRLPLEPVPAPLVHLCFVTTYSIKLVKKIQDRNEARVVQDIARLIVPSAETLAKFGAEHLEILIESVNEGWNNSIPITKTRPQPDYSVGFRREAFTEDQLKRLKPFVSDLSETSFFMATYHMYFPFLTCNVKCGAAALDVADRQNAHSYREILAFSILHNY